MLALQIYYHTIFYEYAVLFSFPSRLSGYQIVSRVGKKQQRRKEVEKALHVNNFLRSRLSGMSYENFACRLLRGNKKIIYLNWNRAFDLSLLLNTFD